MNFEIALTSDEVDNVDEETKEKIKREISSFNSSVYGIVEWDWKYQSMGMGCVLSVQYDADIGSSKKYCENAFAMLQNECYEILYE
jgi:hypothetical protein